MIGGDDPELTAKVRGAYAEKPPGHTLGVILFWVIAVLALLIAVIVLAFAVLGVVWVFHLLISLFP